MFSLPAAASTFAVYELTRGMYYTRKNKPIGSDEEPQNIFFQRLVYDPFHETVSAIHKVAVLGNNQELDHSIGDWNMVFPFHIRLHRNRVYQFCLLR
jgi:hypothetical protein